MGGENNISVEGKKRDGTSLYRVRDSQIFNLGSLVALVALFGGFWSYYRSERDAQTKLLEQVEQRYTRELDRLEHRVDGEIDKFNERLEEAHNRLSARITYLERWIRENK